MRVVLKRHCALVYKTARDARVNSDSQFLYHVKRELQRRGFDVIKKRMWRDGHMVSDTQQYVRTRDTKNGFAVFQTDYALRSSYPSYNSGHVVTLGLLRYSNGGREQ